MKYSMNHGSLEIRIDAEFDQKTLGDFFDVYRQSKKNRSALLREKRITVNGSTPANEEALLHKGDTMRLFFPEEAVDRLPADKECTVVYEDDFVYVVHKDAGVIIHGDPDDTDCLAAMAAAWQLNNGIQAPVRYIHRLDKETTGLVLFVKCPFFQPWFDAMLEAKEVQRKYLAVCTGRAKIRQAFTWNGPIGRDRHVSGKYRVSKTGKEALTKARCIARHGEYLLMDCALETGRTHQIRVHMSESKHPIINDPLYGVPSADFRNMCLWAYRLTFHDPLSHEEITVNDSFNKDYALFRKDISL